MIQIAFGTIANSSFSSSSGKPPSWGTKSPQSRQLKEVSEEGKKSKSSYKWLSRFLKCKYFDPSSLAEWLLALIVGRKPPSWVIVLVDQTTIDGVEVVNAAIPVEGRAVPWPGSISPIPGQR